MTTTLDAIYDHGTLILPRALPLPSRTHVRVTIEDDAVQTRSETDEKPWMKLAGVYGSDPELSAELRRIEKIIEDEFEQIEPEMWK